MRAANFSVPKPYKWHFQLSRLCPDSESGTLISTAPPVFDADIRQQYKEFWWQKPGFATGFDTLCVQAGLIDANPCTHGAGNRHLLHEYAF